jgi:hypothetical protein
MSAFENCGEPLNARAELPHVACVRRGEALEHRKVAKSSTRPHPPQARAESFTETRSVLESRPGFCSSRLATVRVSGSAEFEYS